MKRFPSFSQWKQIFKVLKTSEKRALLAFIVLAVGSLAFLVGSIYFSATKVVPALGGTYIEGVVGQPRFINPLYGETNDIDRTLIGLVFSGLMAYDANGALIGDLAKSYTISDDGKTYEFHLKENTFWHDGRQLDANDIIFTIEAIQNSDYKSPLRANWIDVEAEKISERAVRFILKTPYNSFLENCTVKIIPKHIWENILVENVTLSAYNLQPVGSGPYQFSNIVRTNTGFVKTLSLESYRKYHNASSHIANIEFQFFEGRNELVGAANDRQINGFTTAAEDEIRGEWLKNSNFSAHSFSMPRYVAVFFNNQKTSLFSDVNIRKAFSYAVDKNELTQKINDEVKSTVVAVDSPIIPNFYGYKQPANSYVFNTDQAKSLLDRAGFKENGSGVRAKSTTKKPAFQFSAYLKIGSKGNEVIQLQACLAKLDEGFKNLLAPDTTGTFGKGTDKAVTEFQKKYLPNATPTGEVGTGTRTQLNKLCASPQENSQPLRFTLVTINQPQLVQTANLLKEYWKNVGAEVDIMTVSLSDLKPIIKARSYDALLYGQALGAQADPYPFWHSSQKVDPGLNLSAYENKQADQLLKDARSATNPSTKVQHLEKLQDIIINDAPALFLYNPSYIYWVSRNVQGIATEKIIDPAKRFINITNWFIKTKRIWK